MLDGVLGDLLPSAVAVALSPIPVIAIVLVLGTPRARGNGAAFAAGWVAGLAVLTTAVVLILGRGVGPTTDDGIQWGKLAIGVLFLGMAARQWSKRPRDGAEAKMPGWMTSLDALTAPRAAALGTALAAANPKNVALTLTAAASISQAGLSGASTAIAIAVFVVLGSVTVAGAALFYVLDAERAAGPLGAIERFMAANNAVIMMVILLLLGAKLVGEGLGGL